MKAIWNNVVVAESDDTVVVEGNHYFPLSTVRSDLLRPSATHTWCPWKGEASYYSVDVDGVVSTDGAWFYDDPTTEAEHIRDRVAFWRGVIVTE